jgi:protein-disulfide isomerase
MSWLRFSLVAALVVATSCNVPTPTVPETTTPPEAAAKPEGATTPTRTSRVPKRTRGPKAHRGPDDVRWAVPLDPTSPTQGNHESPLVTIILFEDLASPFSRHLYPTLKALMTESPGDLRLSYRHLPLPHNPQATPSANAAHCAHEQGRFWEMRDAIFRDERPDLARLPADLGLNLTDFHACLTSPKPGRRIAADAQAARRATVGGTPVLFVNGRKSAGALPLADLRALVTAERTAAQARIAVQSQARPTKALYDVITKHGRARSPLSPVPTPIAEAALATLGGTDGLTSIKAWLDLSQEPHRQSLRALIATAREDMGVSLELFPAQPGDAPSAEAWSQRLWCAKVEGKLWPMLEAAAAATRHTHGHPMERVEADAEPHHDKDTLKEVSRISGLDPARCAGTQPQKATFAGPTWLINGRRYDGSLGWGPPALRRLMAMVSPAP